MKQAMTEGEAKYRNAISDLKCRVLLIRQIVDGRCRVEKNSDLYGLVT